MDWLTLSLLSAWSLASADAVTKRYLGEYRAREVVLVRFGLAGLLLLPMAILQPLPPVPLVFWGWMLLLIPLEVLAMLLYVRAIRISPLSHTLPYLAFTPVFTTLTGYLLLDERVTAAGFAGIALVVSGAYLLNLEQVFRGSARDWYAPFGAILRERGSRLMLLVAGIYSLTAVMGKAALLHATPASFGPFYFVALGAAVVVVFGLPEPGVLRVLWRRPVANLVVALFMAVMVVSHFLAIALVEVAYMIAVKRSSLLFGILYGAWWFKERRPGQALAAGTLMVAGVAMIVLGSRS